MEEWAITKNMLLKIVGIVFVLGFALGTAFGWLLLK